MSNRVPATAQGVEVFYSRRADGPYYRWWYETAVKQWRAARVQGHELPLAPLCSSNWKSIPPALQQSLTDHYLE